MGDNDYGPILGSLNAETWFPSIASSRSSRTDAMLGQAILRRVLRNGAKGLLLPTGVLIFLLLFLRNLTVDDRWQSSPSFPRPLAQVWVNLTGDPSVVLDRTKVINPHNFKFILLEDTICTERHPDVLNVIIVHTAPGNYRRRMHIRDSWGSKEYYSMTKSIVIFAMGFTKDNALQKSIHLESERYRDIVQEDFLDAYRNLTYKAIMWLKWSGTYCPSAQYTIKVDDDIIINIFSLSKHLGNLYKRGIAGKRSIICLVWNGMPVLRNKNSKWYIPKEDYANDYFSRYCSGSAYILSQDIVYPMFQNSFKHKFFWVDDFYTTGLLPKGLNVTYHDLSSLYVLRQRREEQWAGLVDGYAIFGHMGNIRTRTQLWQAILKNKGLSKVTVRP